MSLARANVNRVRSRAAATVLFGWMDISAVRKACWVFTFVLLETVCRNEATWVVKNRFVISPNWVGCSLPPLGVVVKILSFFSFFIKSCVGKNLGFPFVGADRRIRCRLCRSGSPDPRLVEIRRSQPTEKKLSTYRPIGADRQIRRGLCKRGSPDPRVEIRRSQPTEKKLSTYGPIGADRQIRYRKEARSAPHRFSPPYETRENTKTS